ncbi:methyltransferase domain-containing protein [Roseospira visakhapatnamensis]|nr:methyltransferase domain-containing protein [Roseospira visakhapatnamensis]
MTAALTDRVQRSFSRSFPSYHDAAGPQAWIAGRLVQELRRGGAPRRFASAFELGCGTGHLTHLLCRDFGFGTLYLNDLAPEARLTAQAAGAAFLLGDAQQIEWPAMLGLVASASMIQWLQDPAQLLKKAAAALAPGGWLAISGYGPEQYRELARLGSSARAPGLCRPEHLAAAVDGPLEVVQTGERVRQRYFPTPRQVLDHLRKTGVNGQARKTWTKSTLARFTAEYARSFGTGAGVPLTYHPVWIIARKHG